MFARNVPRSFYFLVFTVSGFAGLIYESVWSHYLKLFLGHAAYAQTLVLALYMGGMALGAWLASRYSERWANLLVGYALVEAVIGLAALAFHEVFIAATDAAHATVLPALGSEPAANAFKWTLAGALILPQSILLGMTFPLMTAGLIRRYPQGPGGSIAMLYFTNSAGAALGVLASGFVMIGALGLPGTIRAAGWINIAIAAIVWVLARRGDERSPAAGAGRAGFAQQGAAAPAEDRPEIPYGLYLLVAALTGAASFIYEIGWIRMLSLVLGASTHSFELMLSAFILGLACGGLWIRGRIDRISNAARYLAIVQLAMGLLALATLPLYGEMFTVMRAVIGGLAKTDSGYAMFLLSSHGIAVAIMFPATFCAGMTLPLITAALLTDGHGEKSIGAVYGANTLGSIAGVFAAAHLGMPLLGLKGLIASGAVIDVALGLALLWRIGAGPRLQAGAAGTVIAAFAAVLALVHLDSYKMASGVFRRGELYSDREAKLLFHKDGKTSTVSLMDFPEGRSLRTNGKSDGAINMGPGPRIGDEITMVLTGALPLAYRPDARRAAVIGIGTGLTTHTLVYGPAMESVDTIEIEPAMAEASRRFEPVNANAFADPRSRIAFEDAKTFFSTHNRRYDIIVSEPSNPWVSGVSSLFTAEFYRHVRRYLNPGGVLVQWFQLYEIDVSLIASVMLALGAEFPDYAVYAATNSDLLIVAGDERTLAAPLSDPGAIPGLARELARVHVRNLADIELRRIGGKRALAPLFRSFGVPANSDFRPYLDLHAARYRFLQHSASELASLGGRHVPTLAMLEGGRREAGVAPSLDGEDFLDRIEDLRRARYARDFLLSATPPQPAGIPPQLQKDLEIGRARASDCAGPQRSDIRLHALFQLARTVNAHLSAAEGKAVWERLAASACAGGAAAAEKAWTELFAAVGARDAGAMAARAERLLAAASELPASHRQYLVTVAMTGHLALGRREKAIALWNLYSKDATDEKDLELRLLRAHASAR